MSPSWILPSSTWLVLILSLLIEAQEWSLRYRERRVRYD